MIAALFTGSRHYTGVDTIRRDLESLPAGSVVIVGDCKCQRCRMLLCACGETESADAIVYTLAKHCDVRAFVAEWERGKSAGPRRSSDMVRSLKWHRDHGYETRAFAYLTQHPCRGTRGCMAKLKRAGFDVAERRA